MNGKEDALIGRLDAVLPGFEDFCRAEDNVFQQDGEITVHGVFLACSEYVSDRHESLPPGTWPGLARIANELASGTDEELYNAVCTCFLENVAGAVPDLERYLRGAAKACWDEWK